MTQPASPGGFRAVLPAFALMILAAGPATDAAAATLQITGPPGAEVRIEDHAVGALPLRDALQLPRGTYTVTCEARGYQDFSQTVILDEDESWVHLRIRPVRIERRSAVVNNLAFAGLGQFYMGSAWRGWIYAAGEAGGLLAALTGEARRVNDRDDYRLHKADYEAAITPDEIAYFRGLTERAYLDLRDSEDLRDTGLLVAAGSIVMSMLDAWLLCPSAGAPAPVPPAETSWAPEVTGGRGGEPLAVRAGVRVAF